MEKGKLFIVATPIGNLEDMTLRAIHTLKSVGLIAAEDTRHSAHLMKHYEIATPMTSYHDFTRAEKRKKILQKLAAGTDVALISDAGTPCISDPGYRLIEEALSLGIDICAVPGPSVLTAALSVSGLPTDAFFFKGYLPNRGQARKVCLEELKTRKETLVLYETPHRFLSALKDMLEVWGNRRIAVIREMTKLYEETFRGSIQEALAHFQKKNKIKGEITLVIEGKPKETDPAMAINIPDEIEKVMKNQKVSKKDAVQIVSETYGIPKNQVYKASLK
jgi:16S rRNA (cytidine1402-2'-O)-methyltransferase